MLNAFGAPPAVAVVVLGYFVGMVANTIPLPGAVSGGMVGVLLAFGVEADLALGVGALLPRAGHLAPRPGRPRRARAGCAAPSPAGPHEGEAAPGRALPAQPAATGPRRWTPGREPAYAA